ncbi:Gfo/Idh/MocA family oxidoreductase [Pseudoflavonifractor sp. An85]|uniref:Gfo/Idh/MocA family protein n=1 Tax=Pseudoflavonifractor sp. An85 TaxID=1965661 RepID=UPI000B37B5CB|nr:Gfo/Idh/MocA family oxidoreductase [Pseudoflavonifractor sp. An85]OUN25000.1 oxidoreductase [Pseudoflavonifractor sp. An85]
MKQPMTFAVCGFGNRGMEAYSAYAQTCPDQMKLVAVADLLPERRQAAVETFGVAPERVFDSAEKLFQAGKLADVLIISTQDRDHVPQALQALELGYDLILEKPISPNWDECIALRDKAVETGRHVVVCHVLRYTPFYSTLKQMLTDGAIGKLQTIDAVEHVAYWHQAHSFVRGNWRSSEETSPMILAKSCHDMDILRWLADAPCRALSSFGHLSEFKPENAPKGAPLRCLDGCPHKDNCPYDAEYIYLDHETTGFRKDAHDWPVTVLCNGTATEEGIYQALKTGPYGRCVYHCDNDVVDHQVVAMEFENDVTATFTMTAFTRENRRTIRLMGTLGEIEADMLRREIVYRPFGKPVEHIDCRSVKANGGHGGGDGGLMQAAFALFSGQTGEALTDIAASVDSHLMALAAEESRTHGGKTVVLHRD